MTTRKYTVLAVLVLVLVISAVVVLLSSFASWSNDANSSVYKVTSIWFGAE